MANSLAIRLWEDRGPEIWPWAEDPGAGGQPRIWRPPLGQGTERLEGRRRSAFGPAGLPEVGDRLREVEAPVVEGSPHDRAPTAQVAHGPELVNGRDPG